MYSGFRSVVSEPNRIVIEPQEVGSPGPGEVVVRTDRTLISTGTELTVLNRDYPTGSRWDEWVNYPTTIGYSNAATVTEVGESVEGAKVGDRVASTANHATYSVRPANSVWSIPDGVDSEAAAFSTLAEIAMGGVRLSRLSFGESVVIIGAGLVGQLTARFCTAAGGWPVIVIDPVQARLRLMHDAYGIHTLPIEVSVARAEVEWVTKGRMADVVFDVTGNAIALQGALRLARRRGRVVVLGSPRGPVSIDFHDEVHTEGLEIIGAHNRLHPVVDSPHAPWTMARDAELFLEWQAAGVVDVTPMITHRFGWRQIAEAYQMLSEDRTRALGVILDWTEP